jgi:hypothetical protein
VHRSPTHDKPEKQQTKPKDPFHLICLLSFKWLFKDTPFIRFETDELSKRNNLMYSKIRLGNRIVAGNGVPLQVRWKRKIMNIFKAIYIQITGI